MMQHFDDKIDDLLRAVVRPASQGRRATIAELAARISNWDEAIDCAQLHGVLPMLYSELQAIETAIPPDAMRFARKEFERNAFHCMANAAELLGVLGQFADAGIAAMPFKGVVLGSWAYGDMTERTAGDLDVLIHHRDLARATEILKGRGYQLETKIREDGSPESPHYFEYHFERPADGMVLELRWRLELIQPRFRHKLGLDWVWSRRRTAELAGAVVPNLDPVSALLVLCMHGSKHGWTRLMWICDVAKLLEREQQLNWEFAIREAKQAGLWRSLALGVLLAHRAGAAAVPAEVLRRFEADRSARELAEFINENIVAKPGKTPDGLLPYNVQLLGFRDRLMTLFSTTFFRPNERDMAVVKLPKPLQPLYYVIRPFRLLRDRTGR